MSYRKPIIEQSSAHAGRKSAPCYRFLIPQNVYQRGKFQHRTHTVISKDDWTLSDSFTTGVFIVEKTKPKAAYEVSFEILDSAVESTNVGVTEFANLAKLFLLPTKKLHLQLGAQGDISKVLNSRSVLALWEEIYQFLTTEITNEALLKEVKEKGDREFGDVSESIRQVALYGLFFLPLYDRTYTQEKAFTCPFYTRSHVLPEAVLYIDLKGKEVRVEENRIYWTLEGEVSDAQIVKKTRKTFGDLIEEDARHLFKLYVSYCADVETGYPIAIYAHVTETLGTFWNCEQTTEIFVLEDPVNPAMPEPDASSPAAGQAATDSDTGNRGDFHSWILDDDKPEK